MTPRILDTVPEFARLWGRIRNASVRDQVDGWARLYGSEWPDLLRRQQQDYRARGVSWRETAERRVFPKLPQLWRRIRLAHRALLQAIPVADARLRDQFQIPSGVVHVLHVGIGCGAGWATEYEGTPAILYGLENAAELGWTGRQRLTGHVVHELVHLAHSELRAKSGQPTIDRIRGPFGPLYVEGFATRVERQVLSARPTRDFDRDLGWSAWCQAHQRELALEFMDSIRRHRSVARFFGSWYRVGGHIETGYWLGAELIRSLEPSMSLTDIATLSPASIRSELAESLHRMASARAPS